MNRLTAVLLSLPLLLCAPAPVDAGDKPVCPRRDHHPLTLIYPPLHYTAEQPAAPRGEYVLDEKLIGRDAARKAAGATQEGPVSAGVEEEMPAVRFKTESAVTPYVGAGLTDPDKDEGPGTARPVTVEEEKRKPYVGAGIGCELGSGSRFSLGYRYSTNASVDNTETQPIDKTDQPPESHDFSFRLKLDF